MTARIIDTKTKYEGKFLRMDLVVYEDGKGASHLWEAVQRQHGAQAVTIVPILSSGKVVLVRQFRPPVGKFCVEFPAGLRQEGELPMDAALRELEEETGYVGGVPQRGPECASSAGMTGELGVFVEVPVDDSWLDNLDPVQKPDDNEEIEVLVVPLDELYYTLVERWSNGDIIGGSLWAWAAGRESVTRKALAEGKEVR